MRRLNLIPLLSCAACFQPSNFGSGDESSTGSGDGSTSSPTSATTDVTSSPTTTPPTTTEADSTSTASTTEPTDPSSTADTTVASDDDPSTTDPTGDTTDGPVAACDDGNEDPGEVCLGDAGLVNATDVTYAARLVDVDSDDVADLVYLIGDSIIVHQGVGDGTFGPSLFATTAFGTMAEPADVDGDAEVDLAIVDGDNGIFSLGLGDGEGNFAMVANEYAFETLPGALAVFDVDANFGTDVIVGHGTGISVFLSDGAGFPALSGGFAATGATRSIAVGDFDSDGDPDVAYIRTPGGNPTVEVRLGNGNGTFSSAVAIDFDGNGARAIAAGDFDGDDYDDLAYIDDAADVLYVQIGNGAAGFAAATASATGSQPWRLVTADFTSDGTLDVAVGHAGENTVMVLANDGSGAFADPVVLDVAGPVDSLGVGFANDDGIPDLVATNIASQLVSLVLSNP